MPKGPKGEKRPAESRDSRHIVVANGLLPSTHRIDGRFETEMESQNVEVLRPGRRVRRVRPRRLRHAEPSRANRCVTDFCPFPSRLAA